MKLTRTMISILAASLLSMSCASFCGGGAIESIDEANLSRAGDSACASSDECEVLPLCHPTLVCKNSSDSYELPTESFGTTTSTRPSSQRASASRACATGWSDFYDRPVKKCQQRAPVDSL